MNGFGHLMTQVIGPDGEASVQNLDFVAIFLLALLLAIAAIGVFFIWLARRHTETLREEISSAMSAQRRGNARGASKAFAFESPRRWLAIRSVNAPLIQSALGLTSAQACSWEEGLAATPEKRLFIAPPVEGWTLVFGSALPEAREDIDACYRFLLALSHKVGHVQYFLADRVLNHHGWARAEGGRIARAYVRTDETLWHEGARTAAEIELDVRCFDYGEQTSTPFPGDTDAAATNTEKVAGLAANWSLDPATLRGSPVLNVPGLVGSPSQLKRR